MAEPTDTSLAVPAGRFRVEYAVDEEGKMPAKEFLDSLGPATKARFLASFSHFSHNGPQGMTDKMFCQEREDIHAFKCKEKKLRLRIPCFRHGDCWKLTHGFVKPPQSEWHEEEFTRANKIKEFSLRQTKQPKKQ